MDDMYEENYIYIFLIVRYIRIMVFYKICYSLILNLSSKYKFLFFRKKRLLPQ